MLRINSIPARLWSRPREFDLHWWTILKCCQISLFLHSVSSALPVYPTPRRCSFGTSSPSLQSIAPTTSSPTLLNQADQALLVGLKKFGNTDHFRLHSVGFSSTLRIPAELLQLADSTYADLHLRRASAWRRPPSPCACRREQ